MKNSVISMEYALVKNQATKTEECAQTLVSIRQQLEALMADMSLNWQGEAASDFLAKCETLSDKIRAAEQDVHDTADAINNAAELFRKAEENAVNAIAVQNGYSGGGSGGGGGGAF